jgi:hypothetical protein
MNDVRRPAEFFYGFQGSFAEKNRPEAVIFEPLIVIVGEYMLALEQVFVVQEIDLKAGIGKGGYFDLKGKVFIINGYVDTGKPNHLMQPVATLVDGAKAGHDAANLETVIVGFNSQLVHYF